MNQTQKFIEKVLSKDIKNRALYKHPSSVFTLSTTKGVVRSENQDRIIFFHGRTIENSKPITVLALADGMGGMKDGAKCAEITLSTFITSLLYSNENSLLKKLQNAAADSNRSVYDNYRGEGGSTLSAFVIYDTMKAAINVGDSRIYSLRTNNDLLQLTVDDNLESNIIKSNNSNLRNPIYNQLVQYIGIGNYLEPHLISFSSIDSKYFLITSDGVHSLNYETLKSFSANGLNTEDIARRLIFASEWVGGHDNASIAVFSPSVMSEFTAEEYFFVCTPFTQAYLYFPIQNFPIQKNTPQDNQSSNKEAYDKTASRRKKAQKQLQKKVNNDQTKLEINIESDEDQINNPESINSSDVDNSEEDKPQNKVDPENNQSKVPPSSEDKRD